MDKMVFVIILAPVIAVLMLVVKRENPAMALAICLFAGIVVLTYALNMWQQVSFVFDELMTSMNINLEWVEPVLKVGGIAIAVRIASEVCRDAGENGLAAKVELYGIIAVLVIAMPLLSYILQLLSSFL